MSWFSGGMQEPDEPNRVYLQISDDDGRTFGEPEVLADPHGATRAYDPGLWTDPRGRVWYIYNVSNRKEGRHDVWARICEEPDAAQMVWSESRLLGFDAPFCFRINKPTVLSTGEWLMPVTWAPDGEHEWFAGDSQVHGCAISTDEGETWTLHGGVKTPPWGLENMFIERKDGSVLAYMRCNAGTIWASVSKDRGRTWGEAYSTTITNPGSRFFLRALASGRWLLLNSPDPTARTGIVAMLSDDEGVTWSAPVVLDERTEVSYPDACQAEDGTIYAIHDRERHGAMEILLSVFTEEDLV